MDFFQVPQPSLCDELNGDDYAQAVLSLHELAYNLQKSDINHYTLAMPFFENIISRLAEGMSTANAIVNFAESSLENGRLDCLLYAFRALIILKQGQTVSLHPFAYTESGYVGYYLLNKDADFFVVQRLVAYLKNIVYYDLNVSLTAKEAEMYVLKTIIGL